MARTFRGRARPSGDDTAPSQIPVPRVGILRWRMYLSRRERQQAYSREHIAVNKKLMHMACTSRCHAAIVYFPESMNVQTFSTFGTFEGALEIYDAVEEHLEHKRDFLSMDFVELWEQHVQSTSDGFPVLDRCVGNLRALGVADDQLVRLSMAFRSRFTDYMRGEHSMAEQLGETLTQAVSTFASELSDRRVNPPWETDGADDDVVDLVDGSTPSHARARPSVVPGATPSPAHPTPPSAHAVALPPREAGCGGPPLSL